MISRKKSAEAKELLLSINQLQQSRSFYLQVLNTKCPFNKNQIGRSQSSKGRFKFFNQKSPFTQTKRPITNQKSSIFHSMNRSMGQKNQIKKLIDIPKIDIGKINSNIINRKRSIKVCNPVHNRIKIIIKNCNQMKRDYQRLKTVQ